MSPAAARRAALAALYCALALVTAHIVRDDPQLALAGSSSFALAADLIAGVVLVLPALAASRPHMFAWLLAVAGMGWLLAEWSTPAAGAAFTAGLAFGTAWPALLALAALRGSDERRLRHGHLAVAVAGALTTVGVLGVLTAAVYDPRSQGCAQCPANRLLIAGDAEAWHHLGQLGLALTAAWAGAFAVTAAIHLTRCTPARRLRRAPVLVAAAVVVTLFGAQAVHGMARGYLSNDPTDRTLRLAQAASISLVAAGVAWGALRARRTRRRLARVVVQLGAAPEPGGLRDRLAVTLGDPTLQLVFPRDSGWIDEHGRPAALVAGPDREVTRVRGGAQDVCALIHRRGSLDDPALVDELVSTARLAMEHERLHALRRARLDELRASRARIVAAADRERRRLERDLHDGAQQRLVAVAVGIRLLRRRLGPGEGDLDRRLARGEQELNAAIDELRAVAQGLFPSILGEEGLTPAIESLAEEDLRLAPGPLPERRFPAPVESAAYFLVAQALRLTPAGGVAVDARADDGHLVVDVRAEAPIAGVPARVHDRIGAVGGTLATAPGHLHAELPCE